VTATKPSTRDALVHAIARRRRRQTKARWRSFAVLGLLVLALDQISKIAVRVSLEPGESVRVLPGLSLSRVANEGIAFGLFPGRQGVVAILTLVALTAIAIGLAGLVARNATVAAGAGMLVGGSIGNLIDRLMHGAVTDFIDPSRWPGDVAFNLADCGITLGAVLIVLGLVREGEGDGDPD
jgi:signal peptidase II